MLNRDFYFCQKPSFTGPLPVNLPAKGILSMTNSKFELQLKGYFCVWNFLI